VSFRQQRLQTIHSFNFESFDYNPSSCYRLEVYTLVPARAGMLLSRPKEVE
jgi:hypothetical protein